MKKHEAGNGTYGYTYEVQINSEWHKYTFWFKDYQQRDIAMNASKQSLPNAKKFRKTGK